MKQIEIKNIELCPIKDDPEFDSLCRIAGEQNVIPKDTTICPFKEECKNHVLPPRLDEILTK